MVRLVRQDDPMCPLCGFVDTNWHYTSELDTDGDCEVVDCLNCRARYSRTMHVRIFIETELTPMMRGKS